MRVYANQSFYLILLSYKQVIGPLHEQRPPRVCICPCLYLPPPAPRRNSANCTVSSSPLPLPPTVRGQPHLSQPFGGVFFPCIVQSVGGTPPPVPTHIVTQTVSTPGGFRRPKPPRTPLSSTSTTVRVVATMDEVSFLTSMHFLRGRVAWRCPDRRQQGRWETGGGGDPFPLPSPEQLREVSLLHGQLQELRDAHDQQLRDRDQRILVPPPLPPSPLGAPTRARGKSLRDRPQRVSGAR